MTAVLTDTGGAAAPDTAPLELPLTAAQSGMWFAQSLDPLSPAQNTAECLEIDGPLDPELFAEALRRVTVEADALRVTVEDSPTVRASASGPRSRCRSRRTTCGTPPTPAGGPRSGCARTWPSPST